MACFNHVVRFSSFRRACVKGVLARAKPILQRDPMVRRRKLRFVTRGEDRLAFFWPCCLIEMAVYVHSPIMCDFLRLQPSMRLPWRRAGSSGSNPPGAVKTRKDL